MAIWEEFSKTDKTVARLWSHLDTDTRILAARSFYEHDFEDEGALHAKADAKAAALLKFRPSAVRGLPPERRARSVALTRQLDPEIAYSMLTAFHFEQRREMMIGFLDSLGIQHKDGVIAQEQGELVTDPKRLAEAIEGLYSKYPTDQVELYLAVLYVGDTKAWGMIEQVMQERKPA
jgi:hypothetical protein